MLIFFVIYYSCEQKVTIWMIIYFRISIILIVVELLYIVFYMLHIMSKYNMTELRQYNVQFDDAMKKAISGEIFCWHLYLTMTYTFVKHRQFLFFYFAWFSCKISKLAIVSRNVNHICNVSGILWCIAWSKNTWPYAIKFTDVTKAVKLHYLHN